VIVFPPDSIYELRREVAAQMDSGAIGEAEAFRRVLDADPHDWMALRFFVREAEERGDAAAAEQYVRRYIASHPGDSAGYITLSRLLKTAGRDGALVDGYHHLGLYKLAGDPEALAEANIPALLDRSNITGKLRDLPAEEALLAVLQAAEEAAGAEPDEVSRELEPHRLIYHLRQAGPEPVEEEFADRILELSLECTPLLLGILREWGEEGYQNAGATTTLRALALLGEIGDPMVLPEIFEYWALDDEPRANAAQWATRRIADRRPVETFARMREMLSQDDPMTRLVVASAIGVMPAVPGQTEVLLRIARDAVAAGGEDNEGVLAGAATALMFVDGPAGSATREVLEMAKGLLPEADMAHLREVADTIKEMDSGLPPPEETVYDFCGTPGEVLEEALDGDDDVPVPYIAPPKPGRNDPCWCGSGKKYKKCHLASDESH
jgi:hypothetical protein